MTFRSLVKEGLEVLKIHAVRDVTQHDGSTDVDAGLNLVEVHSLRLIPFPEFQISLVDWGVIRKGPPVGLEAASTMATVSSTVGTTEAARSVLTTRARRVSSSVTASSVVGVAIVEFTGNSKVLGSSDQVIHTGSSRVDITHVTRRHIGLDRHCDGVLR